MLIERWECVNLKLLSKAYQKGWKLGSHKIPTSTNIFVGVRQMPSNTRLLAASHFL